MVVKKESLWYRTCKNSFSGTISGIAVCLVGHPFDTLKVRLQTQPVNNPVYKGLADCFIKTIRWEGIRGLYKGVGSPIVCQMFFRASLFTAYYEIYTQLSKGERERLTIPEYFLCGAFTGAVVAFTESPMDLFKSKMQIQIICEKTGAPVLYTNPFQAAWLIGKQYGIRGIYQGLSATWLRDIPSCASFFGFYEISRTYFTPEGGSVSDISHFGLLCSGGIGGFLYWFITYPTDVIKSAMQADELDKSKRRYKGLIDCARRLYYDEGGWTRFYRGFSPCLLRSLPANATMFLVLEKVRHLFPSFS